METDSHIVGAVAEVYAFIDSRVAETDSACNACGKCCDFDSYDHRLFVTTPELVYFASHISPDPIKPMPTGLCPYNIKGVCSVHPHRFAACRIFSCTGDVDAQNRLSEAAVAKLKSICEQSNIPYQYMDLKAALSRISHSGEVSM
jgi:Fe-S-cluster containining protein